MFYFPPPSLLSTLCILPPDGSHMKALVKERASFLLMCPGSHEIQQHSFVLQGGLQGSVNIPPAHRFQQLLLPLHQHLNVFQTATQESNPRIFKNKKEKAISTGHSQTREIHQKQAIYELQRLPSKHKHWIATRTSIHLTSTNQVGTGVGGDNDTYLTILLNKI